MDTPVPKDFNEAFTNRYGFGEMTANSNSNSNSSADAFAIYRAAEWAWQASRESLVIDLPERDAHELSINAMFGYDLARKDAKRSVEAAGLKVKS